MYGNVEICDVHNNLHDVLTAYVMINMTLQCITQTSHGLSCVFHTFFCVTAIQHHTFGVAQETFIAWAAFSQGNTGGGGGGGKKFEKQKLFIPPYF
jgi:hypothetical protein